MKYVKMTLGALVVAAATCCASTFASTGAYNVTLDSFYGSTYVGTETKQTTSIQQYKNEGTINSCTGNYNSIKARVNSTAGGYSSWITIDHKVTAGWNNDSITNVPRAYSVFAKNNSSPCSSNHFGLWYLDN